MVVLLLRRYELGRRLEVGPEVEEVPLLRYRPHNGLELVEVAEVAVVLENQQRVEATFGELRENRLVGEVEGLLRVLVLDGVEPMEF